MKETDREEEGKRQRGGIKIKEEAGKIKKNLSMRFIRGSLLIDGGAG